MEDLAYILLALVMLPLWSRVRSRFANFLLMCRSQHSDSLADQAVLYSTDGCTRTCVERFIERSDYYDGFKVLRRQSAFGRLNRPRCLRVLNLTIADSVVDSKSVEMFICPCSFLLSEPRAAHFIDFIRPPQDATFHVVILQPVRAVSTSCLVSSPAPRLFACSQAFLGAWEMTEKAFG